MLTDQKNHQLKEEAEAIRFLELIRWNGIPISPFSPNSPIYVCSNNKYRCKHSGKYFNVRTNTIFHGSHLSLNLWFKAISMIQQNPNVIAADLASELKLSARSSSILLSKLRTQLGIYKSRFKKPSEIEVDFGALELKDWLQILK